MTPIPRAAPAFAPSERVRVVGVAAVAAIVQVGITLVAGRHQPEARSLGVAGIALLALGPAALLLRRRRPTPALALTFVPTMAYVMADYPKGPVFIALMIAFVNAVLRGRRDVAWAILGAGYAITAWIAPLVTDDGPWPDWSAAAAIGAWLLVLATGSELARVWLDRSAERAQAAAEEARRRTSEERVRIARELHDVLAHNISLINVRAGVALHLVDERPDRIDADQVRPALAAIKDASKEALGELRSVLDVLRQGDGEAAPRAPAAGLADLDRLAERARGTGLDVRVERVDGSGASLSAEGVADGLPAGVDLAAYRVAQEALTNVVRHAGATRARLRVRRTGDELEVQVDDDGPGTARLSPAAARSSDGRGAGGTDPLARSPGPLAGGADPLAGGADPLAGGAGPLAGPAGPRTATGGASEDGRGIAGMRERALALGGTLEAGPRPGLGFRVRARFPLRSDT